MNKEIKRMTTIIGNVKPFYVETIAEAKQRLEELKMNL